MLRHARQRRRDIRNVPTDCEWVIAPPHVERDALQRAAGIPPLVAQLLLNRGIDSADAARAFLQPDFKGLLPPETLPNAVAAGERLTEAARAGRRIVIYGDYDVDGVTATAILWHVLKLCGARVEYYVPDRLAEGYGLNADALEHIAKAGPALVVTVDCGVTAVQEADRARALGLELIITDHHEPRSELPAALIVHPSALGPSPNPNLSGAGVALKVAWALARAHAGAARVAPELREFLLDATALAALGLIADVVPLVGENRIIASYGLRRLKQTQNAGLQALLEVAGLNEKSSRVDDYDVGFLIAPRLNAVGRMGHARLAVELFTEAGPARAAEIAKQLDARNRERQSVERGILKQAEALVVERGFHRDSCRGIVLASPEWHPGVIGIVAARLVDRFRRPTVLIALSNGAGQGSGRSVRHFPLHEVLGACGQHLVSHGGHAMAAGIRIDAARVSAFTDAFLSEAANRLTPADLRPRLYLDDEVPLGALLPDTVARIDSLAPFGMGNHRPRLATSVVEFADEPRTVGATGAHLQFTVREGGAHRRAIAFHRGSRAGELSGVRRLRLAFEPLLNEWNGTRRVELKVIDWKPSSA